MDGQHGEAKWLSDYIIDNDIYIPHHVIDIGAGDGETISNSRVFIQMYGYSAELYDINAKQIERAREIYKINPRVTAEVTAVLPEPGYYKIVESPIDWTLNSVAFSPNGEDGFVKGTTIKEIVEGKKIGVFMIDTEGMDTMLLKSALEVSRPSFIIVEGNESWQRYRQRQIARRAGYKLLNTFNVNQIFILKELLNAETNTKEANQGLAYA